MHDEWGKMLIKLHWKKESELKKNKIIDKLIQEKGGEMWEKSWPKRHNIQTKTHAAND